VSAECPQFLVDALNRPGGVRDPRVRPGKRAGGRPGRAGGTSGVGRPQRARAASNAGAATARLDRPKGANSAAQFEAEAYSRGRSRSSIKRMVIGWPAMLFPKASVNGKEAQRLSVSATAVSYDARSTSDASLE